MRHGKETVLVVEDEDSLRNLVVRILRDHGYNVIEASNGREALQVVSELDSEIHLVLSDLVMPGINGKELISRIAEARKGIKSLLISGYTDEMRVREDLPDSRVEFLQKPFTGDKLASKVRKVLDAERQTAEFCGGLDDETRVARKQLPR